MLGMTTEAAAQEACAPLAAITAALAAKYHEKPIAQGVAESGALLIIYAAPDGKTWTMIGVRPGQADFGCALAVGKDWQVTATILPGKPS